MRYRPWIMPFGFLGFLKMKVRIGTVGFIYLGKCEWCCCSPIIEDDYLQIIFPIFSLLQSVSLSTYVHAKDKQTVFI